MKTLYIAGPMTGHPEFNYPAFHALQAQLEEAGYKVLNPARVPEPCENATWEDWMAATFPLLLQAEGVALLPGWEKSQGARIEYAVARERGIPRVLGRVWLGAVQN